MPPRPEDSAEAELRSYYEHEAALRTRTELRGFRLGIREEFLALLRFEQRRSIIDLGSGPGLDGVAFAEAGMNYVGLDLALGNAALAARSGLAVLQGSIARPPLRPGSFDAGWSMSTFMHVPAERAGNVAAAMVGPLRRGAPLLVGFWGGNRRDEIDDSRIDGERRLFSLRSVDHNRRLLRRGGEIEREATWDVGPDGWEYQVFLLRVTRASSGPASEPLVGREGPAGIV